jgi:hypothetical protein
MNIEEVTNGIKGTLKAKHVPLRLVDELTELILYATGTGMMNYYAPKLTKIIAEHIKAEREAKKDNEDNH